jgi:phosphoribosylglycinamide formyltransferase-1
MSLKIVVLLSGEGTLLQSFINQQKEGLPIEIQAVISNRPNVGGLTRAQKAEILAHEIDHKLFPERSAFEAALIKLIDHYKPDVVVLAGFMRILGEQFVNHYQGRLINIHPALLPKYKGLDTHKRAIEAGDAEHGSSVHLVTSELDGGPVIAQIKLPILPSDTAETLAERTKKREHLLYPEVLRWIAEKRLTLTDGIPCYDGTPLNSPVVLEPDSKA